MGPLKLLLTAFATRDPPPNRQAAATPDLLKEMLRSAHGMREVAEHTADLITGAYFFAMRACEFSRTRVPGRTKTLTLEHITFRSHSKETIKTDHPDFHQTVRYVTICFANQKNGNKMERRTQGKTGHDTFCPVRSWARAFQRVLRHFPKAGNNNTICSLRDHHSGKRVEISSTGVAELLRKTCRLHGAKNRFGFKPEDLGSRSIRSGAAMSLFMMNHSTERIKILGRWSSDAFLVYIRPQVLEWTNTMAKDMTQVKNFLDLNFHDKQRPSDDLETQWGKKDKRKRSRRKGK